MISSWAPRIPVGCIESYDNPCETLRKGNIKYGHSSQAYSRTSFVAAVFDTLLGESRKAPSKSGLYLADHPTTQLQ